MFAVDFTETTTPLGKQHSELSIKGLFEENELPMEHKSAKTHREAKCLTCNKMASQDW